MNFPAKALAWSCTAAAALAVGVPPLLAQNWTPPTAAELTMTSDPKAPGAAAIVLSYDEVDDGDSAEVTLHVRLKVLTEGGLNAGTVELPERIVSNDEFNRQLAARTIHRDGTVIPFVPSAQNTIVRDEGTDHPRRVITFPAVEVGSILEYTCHFAGQNSLYSYLVGFYAPLWRVQGDHFIRQAHFQLKTPSDTDPETTRWVANLPGGMVPVRSKNRIILDVANVAPAPQEELMPPASTVLYNVRFFYFDGSRDKYWGTSGAKVDDAWLDFMATPKVIKAAVTDLTLPTDTDEQKLHKLYDAVQALDNTDLSREHTTQEDKHEARNSQDIWLRKRGDSRQLTLLFVALARAAGYPAYPMAVSSRDQAVFDQNVLSWSQMDGLLAIVDVKGHDIYFDPGTRFCQFAHVAPWHSNVMGVSTEAKLIKIRRSVTEPFSAERTERIADLTVTSTGAVSGTVHIAWLGNAGLLWRRRGLREDQRAVEGSLEKSVAGQVPPGVVLKLVKLEHLSDADAALVADFTVSGTLGSATGKRLIVPEQFFAAAGKPVLTPAARVAPVAFPSAEVLRDQMILHLAPGASVESLPERKTVNIATDLLYDGSAKMIADRTAVVADRTFVLSKIDYTPGEYGALHDFFAGVANADGEQIVLDISKPTAAQ